MPSYIIHSGWWCDQTGRHIGTQYNQSDDRIRTPRFFDVWYECVRANANPAKIIVVDSASPVKPDLTGKDLEFVSLEQNFRHGMICIGKFGGWTRAFSLGAFYAYLNDADYSVFLEQDCLIAGPGIIETAIRNMGKKRISYGTGGPVRIEQSFVIIRHDYILDFLYKFLSMRKTDSKLFTELKWHRIQEWNRRLAYLGLARNEFVPLPFGYGRLRPIRFDDPHLYAQQWETAELEQLYKRTALPALHTLLHG